MGLSTTVGLIERLAVDRALRRICGFPMWKKPPDESTFSRAFAEFAADGLAERTPAALVLHIETADCGIPVSALHSSASMHDSLAAIPLSLMTAERVTNCYDLMDEAYCSSALREHSRSLRHDRRRHLPSKAGKYGKFKIATNMGKRSHGDAEIRASDASAFHFKNNFARSSFVNVIY